MVDFRKAARGRCAPSEFLATAITIPKLLVLAHYRLAGTCGTATKPHDMQAAIACSSCHDLIDGRVKTSDYTKEELRLMHAEGVFHTRNLEKGRLFMIYPTNTGKSGNTFVSPRWKVSGFRENCACGGAGRILAAVRREICLTIAGIQKIDENSRQ